MKIGLDIKYITFVKLAISPQKIKMASILELFLCANYVFYS